MKISKLVGTGGIAVAALVCGLAGTMRANAQWAQPVASAASIPASTLVQPAELNHLLRQKGSTRPLIFQVGSHVMFEEAHIPGAEFVGPGSNQAGLNLLRKRVAGLDRHTPIVIYCGCCPWTRCPNIGPAYETLHKMGFTHLRALYLADNFGTDWVNKGYPVAHSQ
jgi:thiosulfate/3-mercaptopyruvate sulfurtransferase